MAPGSTRKNKLIKAAVMLPVCLVAALLLFELVYRLQLVDTYAFELGAYNEAEDLEAAEHEPTILVMGDSFSIVPSNFPSALRGLQDRYRVINSGLGGSGLVQANIMAQGRIERFDPAIFIYQVYVGNDLFDLRYPIHWGELPFLRNAYWLMAQRLRSLSFLNYRLAQIRAGSKGGVEESDSPFSTETYTPRDRLYLKAEPALLEDTIMARGERRDDYAKFLEELQTLLARVPTDCRKYVLVIPHCSQVGPVYLERTRQIGAEISAPEELAAEWYPFVAGIREALGASGMDDVRVLNPIRILQEERRRGARVYYENDSHLSPEGQAVIAGYLMDELKLGDGTATAEQ